MRVSGNKLSSFYCTQCGNEGIPIIRAKSARELGHLKLLYCTHCRNTTNHVEIRPFAQYTYEDFLKEFNNHNFDKNGQRIDPSWKHFLSELHKKEDDTNE